MRVTAYCEQCECELTFDSETDHELETACHNCQTPVRIAFSDRILQENMVDACPSCGKRAFYVQKDFNRNLGLGIVVICAIIGLYFVWVDRPFLFYAALGFAVVIDTLLYLLLPEVTVCYPCKAVFRGAKRNPEHKGFDLHILDVYEGRSQGYSDPS
ncbi:MAG: hypothetical protein CME19_02095 [Gemmatimonadetes bacterium]|nr:hypothetical protein [Gemmatimonadota bacterium]